ncbi:MAG: hypothetical protein U9O94_08530 [Nanoarchaeota archaeon]|nr:hypothetical protein [Nanoarchaeota archaeon]
MNKKAIQLSVNFLVTMVITIVIFSFSIYMVKKFFTHAEDIKMTYDQRTEKEIERLLDDGSRIAIPFDKKTVNNGDFETFGIGVLNVLNSGESNDFEVLINFSKAFRGSTKLCQGSLGGSLPPEGCGNPDTWLQTTSSSGQDGIGVTVQKTVRNNEQERFLLGISPDRARPGTYVFDMIVCVDDKVTDSNGDDVKNDPRGICEDIESTPDPKYPDAYDTIHKLYVNVP